MPLVEWDRLLETCYRRNADVAILSPGCPPMLWIGNEWRALQVPPLDLQEVAVMAAQRIGSTPQGHLDGYTYCDFAYGSVARYRLMAAEYPHTKVMIITRLPTPPHASTPSHS